MSCPVCGRYGEPERETGYDANDVCPTCQRYGWTVTSAGELICEWPQPRVTLPSTTDDDTECPF